MTRFVLCAALVVGVAIGASGHALVTAKPHHPEPARGITLETPRPVVTCTASLAPADLAALRGELAALLDERLGARPAATPAQRPAEATAQALAAVEVADRVLDAALADGHWKDADSHAFREALGVMDDAQRDAAMSRLITALNGGILRPETTGPVL